MAAAAAGMGIGIDSLRAMKAMGCPAFRGSRVHEAELVAWERPGTDAPISRRRDDKLDEEIRKLRVINDQREGKLIARQDVANSVARILGPADQLLEQKLVQEWPALIAGATVADARAVGRRIADEIRAAFRAFAEEWK